MDFEPSPAELELVEAVRAAAREVLERPDPSADGAGSLAARCAPRGLFTGTTVGYVLSLAEIGQLSLPLAEHVAALHPAHAEAPALARLATAALAVGLGRRALAAAIEDVKGGSAPPRQKVQFTLSDMATEVDAASLAVWSAAFQRDAGRALDAEAAAAHLLATRTATRALHAALGLVTGPKRPPLELAYLDARRLEAAHGGEVEDEDLIASRVLEET